MADVKDLHVGGGIAFSVTLSAAKIGKEPITDESVPFAFTITIHSVAVPDGPLRALSGTATGPALARLMDSLEKALVDWSPPEDPYGEATIDRVLDEK